MNVDEMDQAARESSAIIKVQKLDSGELYVTFANGAKGKYDNMTQAEGMSQYYRLAWKPSRKCPWGRCNGYGASGGFDYICSCSSD